MTTAPGNPVDDVVNAAEAALKHLESVAESVQGEAAKDLGSVEKTTVTTAVDLLEQVRTKATALLGEVKKLV